MIIKSSTTNIFLSEIGLSKIAIKMDKNTKVDLIKRGSIGRIVKTYKVNKQNMTPIICAILPLVSSKGMIDIHSLIWEMESSFAIHLPAC